MADEVVCERLFTSLLYKLLLRLQGLILPSRTDQAKLDIVVDGVVEEERLLLNQADLSSPPLEVDIFEVPARGCNCAIPQKLRGKRVL